MSWVETGFNRLVEKYGDKTRADMERLQSAGYSKGRAVQIIGTEMDRRHSLKNTDCDKLIADELAREDGEGMSPLAVRVNIINDVREKKLLVETVVEKMIVEDKKRRIRYWMRKGIDLEPGEEAPYDVSKEPCAIL